MSIFPFRKPNQEPDAETPWSEVPVLLEKLGELAEKSCLGDKEVTMFVMGDMQVRITIKRNGSEFKGRGRNPWEAANDLMLNAGIVRDKIMAILSRPAGAAK